MSGRRVFTTELIEEVPLQHQHRPNYLCTPLQASGIARPLRELAAARMRILSINNQSHHTIFKVHGVVAVEKPNSRIDRIKLNDNFESPRDMNRVMRHSIACCDDFPVSIPQPLHSTHFERMSMQVHRVSLIRLYVVRIDHHNLNPLALAHLKCLLFHLGPILLNVAAVYSEPLEVGTVCFRYVRPLPTPRRLVDADQAAVIETLQVFAASARSAGVNLHASYIVLEDRVGWKTPFEISASSFGQSRRAMQKETTILITAKL